MSESDREMAELEAMYELPDLNDDVIVVKSADGYVETTIRNGAIVAIVINSSCPSPSVRPFLPPAAQWPK